MGRWTKTPGKPSEETYECTLYGMEIVQTVPDLTEAEKQLHHANEQLWAYSNSKIEANPSRHGANLPNSGVRRLA